MMSTRIDSSGRTASLAAGTARSMLDMRSTAFGYAPTLGLWVRVEDGCPYSTLLAALGESARRGRAPTLKSAQSANRCYLDTTSMPPTPRGTRHERHAGAPEQDRRLAPAPGAG